MPLRRSSYPQVDPRAAGLATSAVVTVPARLPVEESARLLRRRRGRLLLARVGEGWAGAVPETLERARRLGLDRVPVRAVLWRAPRVSPETPEVLVRRRLGPAVPFLVVGGAGGVAGAILAEPGHGVSLPQAAASALARLPAADTAILRLAGRLGDELHAPVAAVGGLVRDLLLRKPPAGPRLDVDLVVEGAGGELARRLAAALGGRAHEHPAFLTATVELGGGRRIDVATARRERYRTPGALPQVERATLLADLWRRDFSANALAVRLSPAAWGQLLDPTGGRDDLARRRIRVLHPLSFVEDPTRVFRAVRLATRLDCRLEPATRHLLVEAARLVAYPALSGDRLRAELGLVLEEAAPAVVLARLARLGGLRLLDGGSRGSPRADGLLRRAAASARTLAVSAETRESLFLLALTAPLPPASAAACASRLGLPLSRREALERARAEAPALVRRLSRAGREEAYTLLRSTSELVVAWAHGRARRATPRQHLAEHLAAWRRLRPLLAGDDLAALGVRPGPELGRLLRAMLAAQAGGRVRSREEALAWVRATLDAAAGATGNPTG